MSAFGVKRTLAGHAPMSASDPKRTLEFRQRDRTLARLPGGVKRRGRVAGLGAPLSRGPKSAQGDANPARGDAKLKAGLWTFQLQIDDAVGILEPRHLYPGDNCHAHRSHRIVSYNVGRVS